MLRTAADLASVDGLEGLSIGRLSTELGISKAGVFRHFGSKEALQLATIRSAAEVFAQEVIEPALAVPAGLRRCQALCDNWLRYAERGVFPGGCFFLAAAAEFDSRPGAVRDELAATRRAWLDLYVSNLREGRRVGELRRDVDAAQLAFELDALAMAADLHARLCDDPSVWERARTAMRQRLAAASTPGAT